MNFLGKYVINVTAKINFKIKKKIRKIWGVSAYNKVAREFRLKHQASLS